MPDTKEMLKTIHPSPHAGVMKIHPYIPGDFEVPGRETVARLASNESALGPSPLAVEAVRAGADALHRYPDGASRALRHKIGEVYGLDPDRIITGSGSEQVLEVLAEAFLSPGDEAVYSQYGFLVYPISTLAAGGTPVKVPEHDYHTDVDGILGAVTDKTRVVFIANPNNPTGTYIPADEVRRLRDGLREDILLVIDVAYSEYVEEEDYTNGHELVDEAIESGADNVLIAHTFSKIYGLAALRVGWAYAPESVLDALNRVRPVFNLTSLGQVAAIAAVGDQDHVSRSRAHNSRVLPQLSNEFIALGFNVLPSVANFILVKFPGGAEQSKEVDGFLRQHGVIVRPVAGYDLADCLRITIGDDRANEALVAAMNAYVGG